MRAVTAQTMQAADRQAISGHGIPGLQLMENAGCCCVEAIEAEFGEQFSGRLLVVAGSGNNAGDGFVIARLLLQKGWDVKVCVLAEKANVRGDAAINLEKLQPESVIFCTSKKQLPSLIGDDIRHADLIVDAIFGTGLNCAISGVHNKAVELINASGRLVLSVDIPSGVHATSGKILGNAVRADITVTFAFAKLGHILFPGTEFTGRLTVSDIGIPAEVMEQAPGYECLDESSVKPLLQRRERQAHKGRYGHCLIIAGSTGKTGAAALCANSAVRAGSGLVSLAVPESLNAILEIKTTEAMTVPLPDAGQGHIAAGANRQVESALAGKNVLAIGPGIGRHPETTAIVRGIVESVDIPMVIDADGLNALAVDASILLRKKSGCIILTPHPGEMSRLTGSATPDNDLERIATAEQFAQKYGVYLVLKGARTVIAAPDGMTAINTSGNPGMASGGMGDVLTGIIASLCGQGYVPWDALRLGVFIHGYSADMVAAEKGEIGITATDVIEKLPYALKKLGTGNSE